jgi:hypothetical protein
MLHVSLTAHSYATTRATAPRVARALLECCCRLRGASIAFVQGDPQMIRKLRSGEYRLYSIKKDARTGRRRNLGTFKTLDAAKQHEREVQFFKRH